MKSLLRVFQKVINKRILGSAIFACLVILCCAGNCRAQSLGDPIVRITFGSGVSSYGPALAADSGSTTYIYTGPKSPDDGQYGIYNTTRGLNNGWVLTRDHTGDPNGYMMIVNASYDPGLFYTRKVTGLCSGTTYQFGAWIKNILKSRGILPDVSFSIEAPDGTPLGGFDTHNIPADSTWRQYDFTFKTKSGDESVVLKMTNNAPGGGGNDIAIDDITFRPYGTPITVQFQQNVLGTFCTENPQTLTINSLTPLDPSFAQRLQQYTNGTWVNLGNASTASSFTFTTPTDAGSYAYRLVKADSTNIDYSKCVVASNQLSIAVVPPPAVNFIAADTVCANDTVIFKDNTVIRGAIITGWTWDFGDGATSTAQNPKHLFLSPGDHTVKLTVASNLGCSGIFSKAIHVVPAVREDFIFSINDCASRAVTFTDKSVIPEGRVTLRKWDFGDGTTREGQGTASFIHTYDTTGVYKVSLSLTTSNGCVYKLIKDVAVHVSPKVNFVLPEVCLSDVAQFADSTVIETGIGLTYLWDFGDQNATSANPNTSTAKNPTHRYTQAKQYNVKLTVFTSDGCQATLTKQFTVNGANPQPDFTVLNSSSLCSNRDVYFVNNSTVDFGNVTRLKWDFGDGSVPQVDENPRPGKQYHHKFTSFGLPQASKNLVVRLTAYSGAGETSCVQSKDQTITLLAAPKNSIIAPDSVCLNFGPVQFVALESNGMPGSGFYTGTAITPAGMFDPQQAGVGAFDIKYIFVGSSAGSCADTVIHKIKVTPVAKVDAGPDVIIDDKQTLTLHPTVTGEGLTYLWTPATGLSSNTIANPVVTTDHDITYTLTVTNKYGCEVSAKVSVFVLHQPVVPNAFTPNGDGVNDTWFIKNLNEYSDCTVEVFSRYGQKVYTSVGYPAAGWDGRFKGSDLPVGVYYYVINPKHGHKTITGFVTIVR